MKTFWTWLAKILLVIVIIEGAFIYHLYTKNEHLVSENIELENQLLASEKELNETRTLAEALEKKTLEGVMRETNKAVISGWETLMRTVEEELEKAKDGLSRDNKTDTGTVDQPILGKTEQNVENDEQENIKEELDKEADSSESKPAIQIEGERT